MKKQTKTEQAVIGGEENKPRVKAKEKLQLSNTPNFARK